ncbi:nucleic acid-binding protein [Thermococcus sp. 4557]|uniref:PIN domain-containing protein n=1 Tax=Thermococcus sp. (strain CGMCC 1.5172 / 4557) TaxID=1042877 RepID=UPI000219EBB5|nr:PIN domain-containing protein [Thermococcus sp. 4557]AEK72197.1 nucleic acid-binding protein [Thermococcus sp. 4557]
MKDVIFIDTSVIVEYILNGKDADAAEMILLSGDTKVTSMLVYRESLGALAMAFGREKFGIKGKHSLRKFIRKNGWKPFEPVLNVLDGLLSEVGIVILQDVQQTRELRVIMEKYNLLPSDAQITLTCKSYGIQRIATFDSDFKRVEFLETVGV